MRRFRQLAVAGLVLAAVTAGAAAPAATAAPAPKEARAAVPAYDPEAVADLLGRLPDDVTAGGLVRVAGAGLRTPWTGTAAGVSADARFPIGSVSKTFTGAVVLQLVAEHRIGLDEPVRRHLPELLPAAYAAVTVRQLLDHTSDFPMAAQVPGDPRALVAASFAADTHTPAPGAEQQYNGLNYFVLGLLVERVTGRTYAEELQRRVLRPLGLRDTGLSTDPKVAYFWAEGGLVSTAADLDRFQTALLRGRLLPPAQQATLFEVPAVPGAKTNTCLTPAACFSAGGLMKVDLPGGATVWGKTGSSGTAWTSGMFATRDLSRHLVYALNPRPEAPGALQRKRVVDLATAAFSN
ncbi:serine hydrolase domain-containing protein [Streptomyces sp. PvR034]|uniref:serine hydrolase domain-containing protein n=1 Tax=Streptomyces sp. PvR034 TaxID=3156401 RepID=UPI003392DD0D